MADNQSEETQGRFGRLPGLHRRAYPRNPIGVIALFVSFIDAIATISLKMLLDAGSGLAVHLVVFIVAFPSLLLILFFGTLWFRRESLYSPSDFREDSNFMQLMAKVDERVERVEIRQRAAQLDPRGDSADVFALIPELLAKSDFETVMGLGRAFLKVKRYSNALEVFTLLTRLPLSVAAQSQARAFLAYSLNGLGRHKDALVELSELRRVAPGDLEKFWPALAFSYSYYKLENATEYSAWLDRAMSNPKASEYLESAGQIYPEFKAEFQKRSLSTEKVVR